MDIVNGVVLIPKMTINSTLGFMEISGIQDTDFNYEYKISVPWKMVSKAAANKLFKKKAKQSGSKEEAIQYGSRKTKFVTIQLRGDSTDYNVSLSKRKE
jgi:hypothetical protein